MKRIIPLTLCLLLYITGYAQITALENKWEPDGSIRDMLKDGNTMYMAGSFSRVNAKRPYGAVFDSNVTGTGRTNMDYVCPNGVVYTTISDGNGGWYIGGEFTQVGDEPRNKLAYINADGTLNPWNPDANGTVRSLFLNNGTLYVGGSFTQIGGQTRNRLAAFNALSGTLETWNVSVDDNTVYSILVHSGTVYFGGDFTSVNSTTRNCLASADATTATLTTWNPDVNGAKGIQAKSNPTMATVVYTMAIKDDALYIGGAFANVGNEPRPYLAGVDLSTGEANSFVTNISGGTAYLNGAVYALTFHPSSPLLYVGGEFMKVGTTERPGVANFNYTTGAMMISNPNPSAVVRAFAWGKENNTSDVLYIGGDFVRLFNTTGGGNTTRNAIAAIGNVANNNPLRYVNWDPNIPSGKVYTLAINGSNIYAGGNFTYCNPTERGNMYAIDVNTGHLKDWDPKVDGTVYNMKLVDNILYIGGGFTKVNNVTRNKAAAITLSTAALNTSFVPNVSRGDYVLTIAVDGNKVYLGGNFDRVSGTVRNYLAMVDATTGALNTDWNPNPNNFVRDIQVANGKVYVGGDFSQMGSVNRSGLAAFDATTGNFLSGWIPATTAIISKILIRGNTLYALGNYGGVLTALNAETGSTSPSFIKPTDFDYMNYNKSSTGLAEANGVLYTSLFTSSYNGSSSDYYMASANLANGTATWQYPYIETNYNNASTNYVYSIYPVGNMLYVGGRFTQYGTFKRTGIIVFKDGSIPSLPVTLVSYTANATSNGTTLHWHTASEQNNKGFEIYRSGDEGKFIKIGESNSSTTTATATKNYIFTDKNPLNGNNYYKLVQIDNDGKTTELGVRIVSFSILALSIQLYPNPVKKQFTIAVDTPGQTLSIYNTMGKQVFKQQLVQQQTNINIAHFAPGVYYYRYGKQGGRFVKE